MLSRVLRLHPDVLSFSEFFALLVTRDGRPALIFDTERDGPEFWELLTQPHRLGEAIIDGGHIEELAAEPVRARFGPNAPRLSYLLPWVTDRADALYDHLAATVPTWPRRPMLDQYRALFTSMAEFLGRRVVVERSGYSLVFLHKLLKFDEAKIVHMHRDGPACAVSMSKNAIFRAMMLGQEARRQVRHSTDRADLRRRFQGLITPPYDIDAIMEYDLPLWRFGELWSSAITGGAERLRDLPPHRWTQLRYEDVVTDPRTALTGLAEFIGISAPAQWLDAADSFIDAGAATSRPATLDPAVRARLEEACGPGRDAVAELDRISSGSSSPAV